MIETKKIFIGAGAIAICAIIAVIGQPDKPRTEQGTPHIFETTNYGAFLAAQHAVAVNDFDRASDFAAQINDVEYTPIQNTKYLADFLSGKLPDNAHLLKDEKNIASGLIYDAYLLSQDNWTEMFERHRDDESAMSAPLRIWPAIANNYITVTLKFVDGLPTNESWKSFVRGQIYAETGKPEKAAAEFVKVRTDFMNINDFMYIMSFYNHHNMNASADALHRDFTARPGGMFMLDYKNIPDWSVYAGLKNALAFTLVQNVSHTQAMMYSDLSILLLRMAEITGDEFSKNTDAIHYYLGQFFFNNDGDYNKHFEKISADSPFYLFGLLRSAEKSGDYSQLQNEMKASPLFVPAANALVATNIQNNNKKDALKVVNQALNDENITEAGRAFFTKSRAQVYFAFGDMELAQSDLHEAAKIYPMDSEIMSLQAKIWAAENREIETAYEYAMLMIKKNPADVFYWDTLGRVVAVREGVDAALELIERVGEVSNSCSSLFEHLGDLYTQKGDVKRARDAYLRAIDLSNDGLSIKNVIEKKLRNL